MTRPIAPSLRVLLVSGLLPSLVASCGSGPRVRSGELHPGRADGEPSMECLPDPDVADDALSESMRFGLRLAAEAFAVPPPEPPAERDALTLQAWSEHALRPWIERTTTAIEAARRELDIAAEQEHRERIMGGAVVGLMYEHVGRVLVAIPRPDDLDDEPEILEIYQQVIRSQAAPYLETARRAYHACTLNARQPDTMRHWSRFCADREDGLPQEPAIESGETQVEVIAE